MEIIDLNLTKLRKQQDDLIVTIGAFDGIHKGHKAILDTIISKKGDKKTAVFTFDNHPDYELEKRYNCGFINEFFRKTDIFYSFGIDYLYILPKDVLKKTAYEFNELLKELNVKSVVVGRDFIYGANKSGDIETLRKDFNVEVVEDVMHDKEKISSTRIRNLLSEGKIKEARELMLYDFIIIGDVVEGAHIGEELGYKTANIDFDSTYQTIKPGVYKVSVVVHRKKYSGVANYGINPTCNLLNKPRLEVHILNFKKVIYGSTIEVIFEDFIRPEKKFSSREELIKQIKKDIKYVKESL